MKKLAKGFSLVELMIVVAIIGILSAVAIPNFMKFQAKSRQTEAKTNLKGFHTAVTSYFAEKNKLPTAAKIDSIFSVEGNNLYAYHFRSDKTVNSAAMNADVTCSSAQTADWSDTDGTWVSQACGNVDNDNFIDSWTINGSGCLANGAVAAAASKSVCSTAVDNAAGNDVDN